MNAINPYLIGGFVAMLLIAIVQVQTISVQAETIGIQRETILTYETKYRDKTPVAGCSI